MEADVRLTSSLDIRSRVSHLMLTVLTFSYNNPIISYVLPSADDETQCSTCINLADRSPSSSPNLQLIVRGHLERLVHLRNSGPCRIFQHHELSCQLIAHSRQVIRCPVRPAPHIRLHALPLLFTCRHVLSTTRHSLLTNESIASRPIRLASHTMMAYPFTEYPLRILRVARVALRPVVCPCFNVPIEWHEIDSRSPSAICKFPGLVAILREMLVSRVISEMIEHLRWAGRRRSPHGLPCITCP
jgi:hypothetical protein